MNQNRSKIQKCSNISTRSVSTICWYTSGWKITYFWLRFLLHFWFKNYYISGFYYDSGWKITTFLDFTTILVQKLLHFWVLLQLWFKSYYVSGFTTLLVIYYVSGFNIVYWFSILLQFSKCFNVAQCLWKCCLSVKQLGYGWDAE